MSGLLKPWLVLAAIFVAGALSGSALTMALSSHFMHPPDEAKMRTRWMAHLTEKLNLTADQQAKIRPILDDAAKNIQALHHEEVSKVSQIFKSTDDQIAAILTPEQNTELQKLEAEREKAFPGHMHFHERPDDEMPPPPGPPGSAPAPPGQPPGQPAPPRSPDH